MRTKKRHWNAKWCTVCALDRRKRPRGKLSKRQEAIVRRLAGKMYIKELAKKVGTSDSNLDRWARDHDVNLNALKYPESVVREVCNYYAKHGRPKTARKFRDVNVRSIVERYYDLEPRQTRWTDYQIAEAARMAGLLSYQEQARYFNRPNAHEGAIKSLWVKRLKLGGEAQIHGMPYWKARHLVKDSCPTFKPRHLKLCLWVDMARHLKDGTPSFIREAIKALADFQRWLFQTHDPKRRMFKLIEERAS